MKKQLSRGYGGGPLFVLVLILCLAILFNWPQLALSREKGEGPSEYAAIEVSVKKGDTLWTLAKRHGNKGQDIRVTVAEIRRINQIGKKEFIYPGQSLLIPIN